MPRDILTIVFAVLSLCSVITSHAGHSPELLSYWASPKSFKKLSPHPRLFITNEQIERMKGGREVYESDYARVVAAAETALTDMENPMAYLSELNRAVQIQGRLTSLAIQWFRTGDRRYLEAAVNTVEKMESWLPENTPISLWHGQYIAGVAVAYDLLYNDMTAEERGIMVSVGRRYLRHWLFSTGHEKEGKELGERGNSWWIFQVSNWNSVCSSGAGMLALAMYDALDEAQMVIDRVKAFYRPTFDELTKNEGGWVEGLGYWNWTMHYLCLFGISYERATNTKYDEFRSKGFRKGLTFGTYFCPHGVACGFGDNQHPRFSGSLIAAAKHLGHNDEIKVLADHWNRMSAAFPEKPFAGPKPGKKFDVGYSTPQDLLIVPDLDGIVLTTEKSFTKYFPEQGWGAVADQWPKPSIFAAVRGGICEGHHTHDDLLSWHAVIGKEKMIHNIHHAIYEPTGFYGRADDVYERSPASKNTLFVAGVSAYSGKNDRLGGAARAKVTQLTLPTGPAILMEARKAFNYRGGRSGPRVLARLFAVLDDKALLVLDRVESSISVPVEARAHTTQKATFGTSDILLQGKNESARMTFASDSPSVLRRATALMTHGGANPPTVIRFQTKHYNREVTLASLLTKGGTPASLTVASDKESVTVTVKQGDWGRKLVLTNKLQSNE